MNKKKILLIAPLMDIPTITSNLAVYDILDYIKDRDDLDVDLLWGLGANRLAFNLYTKLKKYDGVIYYGHGQKNKLVGEHLLGSIINKRNIGRLDGAPITTMACLSGKILAYDAILSGTKAYIGTDDLYYAAYPEKENNFLADWIDYTTIKEKALLDGKTYKEAYDLYISRANHYLSFYKQHVGYRNYDWYAGSLEHNIMHTKLYGDPNTRLY